MRNHQPVRHTADVALRITADTLEELFHAAFEGMASIQSEKPTEENKESPIEKKINLFAPDRTALLIDFLSEVHTLSDIYNTVFTDLEIEELTDNHVSARVKSYSTSNFQEDIKAVTHSEANIHKTEKGKLETIVVLDI